MAGKPSTYCKYCLTVLILYLLSIFVVNKRYIFKLDRTRSHTEQMQIVFFASPCMLCGSNGAQSNHVLVRNRRCTHCMQPSVVQTKKDYIQEMPQHKSGTPTLSAPFHFQSITSIVLNRWARASNQSRHSSTFYARFVKKLPILWFHAENLTPYTTPRLINLASEHTIAAQSCFSAGSRTGCRR